MPNILFKLTAKAAVNTGAVLVSTGLAHAGFTASEYTKDQARSMFEKYSFFGPSVSNSERNEKPAPTPVQPNL